MKAWNPRSYGPAIAAVLERDMTPALNSGTPDESSRAALAGLDAESIVAPRRLMNRPMAMCCLAGLWLRHDFLDESHQIIQEIETPSGSYWHGIVHRREGDFANSKYWFRRAGDHPVFSPLCRAAGQLAKEADAGPAAEYLVAQTDWDALRFVDLCQAAADQAAAGALARKIQKREWELLFDFCYHQAVGDT
jgi:hypothetical protein